ncbi:hypothetical protein RRG08_008720 [Elysia crispata]|uniref:Uncharacterized protein n=1 Tax=Elysia crispata TaxID=231223 RepID=A0AAE0XPU0_9GAST|nr:hypothetical protein RRG08_008720 [Elysia crispata]
MKESTVASTSGTSPIDISGQGLVSNLISVGLTPHQLNNLTPLLERKVEKCGCIGAFKGKGSAPKTITLKIETTLDMIGQEMILEKLTLDEKRLEAKEANSIKLFPTPQYTKGNYQCTPKGNYQCTPNGNYQCTPNGNYQCTPNGNYQCTPKGNYQCTPKGNYQCTPKGNYQCTPNGNYQCTPKGNYQCTPKGNYQCTPKGNYQCTPKGNYQCTPKGNYQCTPKGNYQCTPKGNYQCTPKGNYQCTPKGNYQCTPKGNYQCTPKAMFKTNVTVIVARKSEILFWQTAIALSPGHEKPDRQTPLIGFA